MLRKVLLLLSIPASVFAGAIDTGSILSIFGGPGTSDAKISSTSENFSLNFESLSGTSISTPDSEGILVHPGDPIAIQTSMPLPSFPIALQALGQGTIDGTFYPSLYIDYPSYGVNSSMTLTTSFDAVEGETHVPFTMTGYLEVASATDPNVLLLNEPISGGGYADVILSLQELPFNGQPSVLEVVTDVSWTFTPEPSALLLALTGLGLIASIRAVLHRRAHR